MADQAAKKADFKVGRGGYVSIKNGELKAEVLPESLPIWLSGDKPWALDTVNADEEADLVVVLNAEEQSGAVVPVTQAKKG